MTFPSGAVDTFTLFIVSSSSQRTLVTSKEKNIKSDKKNIKTNTYHMYVHIIESINHLNNTTQTDFYVLLLEMFI